MTGFPCRRCEEDRMGVFKSSVARLARLFKKSRDAWKAKALDRQQQLRAAHVKIRDLEYSRAYWKARALAGEQAQSDARDTPAPPEQPPDAHALIPYLPPKNHQYPIQIMQLSMLMYLRAAAFGSRGVARVLSLMRQEAQPAHTTILNWVYRYGLAVLNRAPEWRNDWIYIADHTIALGPAKCLVILGISVGELQNTGYSPSHQAMQVLAVEVTTHSTGPWVAEILNQVAKRTGPPVQIVADHGSDLRCGIKLFLATNPRMRIHIRHIPLHCDPAERRIGPRRDLDCLSGGLPQQLSVPTTERSGLFAAAAPTHQGTLHESGWPCALGAAPLGLL